MAAVHNGRALNVPVTLLKNAGWALLALLALYCVAAFVMAFVATHVNYYNFTVDQYMARAHMPLFKNYRAYVGPPTKAQLHDAGGKTQFFLEGHKRDLRLWMLHGTHGYRIIVPYQMYSVDKGVRNTVTLDYDVGPADHVAKHWTYSFGDLVKLHGQQLTAQQPGITNTPTWGYIANGGLGAFISEHLLNVHVVLKPSEYAKLLATS